MCFFRISIFLSKWEEKVHFEQKRKQYRITNLSSQAKWFAFSPLQKLKFDTSDGEVMAKTDVPL